MDGHSAAGAAAAVPVSQPEAVAPAAVPTRLTVLYIAGSGRSGSTLLDRILGQLDGFCSVGELCNLWERGLVARRRCGCGTPVDQCPVWSAVLARAFGDPLSVDAARLAVLARRGIRVRSLPEVLRSRRRPARGDLHELQAALAHVYRAVQQETGCRVIVDSSKSPTYAELLATLPGVDLRVVHLVRDPRATAFSFRRRKELPDFGDAREMLRQPPSTSARRWAKWQVLTELLAARRPGRYLRLRYEDFIDDPGAAVQRVAAQVGPVPSLPFTGRRTVHLGTTHSVSGNPNRFTTGDVELRADEEWVAAMARRDRLTVTFWTWPLLRRYGYRLRT